MDKRFYMLLFTIVWKNQEIFSDFPKYSLLLYHIIRDLSNIKKSLDIIMRVLYNK